MLNANSPIVQDLINKGGMRDGIPLYNGQSPIVESVSGKPTIDLAALGKMKLQKQLDEIDRLTRPVRNDKIFDAGVSPEIEDKVKNSGIQEDHSACPAAMNQVINNNYPQPMMGGYGYYSQQPYYGGYNPYGYYQQPQVVQNPYMYGGGYYQQPTYYGNNFNYAYNPYGYQQNYAEQMKQREAAANAQRDLWARLLVNAHNYFGDKEMTMDEAREVFTPKPVQTTENYYKDKVEEVSYPGITIKRGDTVIYETKARTEIIHGNDIYVRDMEMANIQRIHSLEKSGAVGVVAITQRAANYQESYRKKFPIDMPLEEFFGPTGNQMYIDYLNDVMREQQSNINLLYDNSLYAQLIAQHTKNTNPYAYNSFLQSIANRGRINQKPFNLGDMEIDLPASMQTESARRRSEFLRKIFEKDNGGSIYHGTS